MIKPHMRIAINARYSLNPSLVSLRLKYAPMVIQVSLVVPIDDEDSVLIEAIDHQMFKVRRTAVLQQLARKPTRIDEMKPRFSTRGKTFKGVSIE
ncbi:MAG: hypothetical protein AAF959_07665 [Cyanobacteria bacterium P01_D01_bin.56]